MSVTRRRAIVRAGRHAAFARALALSAFLGLPLLDAQAECPRAAGERARIGGVEDRLILRLDDGRRIRLVGLDPIAGTPTAPDLGDTARDTAAATLVGTTIDLTLLDARPDRWGRLAGRVDVVEAPPGSPPRLPTDGGLAAALIASGQGRYLSEPAARPCRDALLAAERTARSARLGLWRDPYYAVLSVDDGAAFAELSGTLIVAEGKLTAARPSPYRTTLRFASSAGGRSGRTSYGGRMLVATIPPRIMKLFQAQSIDFNGLIGRSLRFRGLLDMRFGPQIELAGPDDVELLDRTP